LEQRQSRGLLLASQQPSTKQTGNIQETRENRKWAAKMGGKQRGTRAPLPVADLLGKRVHLLSLVDCRQTKARELCRLLAAGSLLLLSARLFGAMEHERAGKQAGG